MGVWPGEGGCRARDRAVRVRARGLRERIILLHRGKTVAELYKLSALGTRSKTAEEAGGSAVPGSCLLASRHPGLRL